MNEERKSLVFGLIFIFIIFITVFFILPWVSAYGINSEGGSARILSWIVIAVVLIVAIVLIPDLMLVWFGIPILAILAIWLIGGEMSGGCVPIVPGYCD